jgi:hypothetical protein
MPSWWKSSRIDSDRSNTEELLMPVEGDHLAAALIAKKLREAGLSCEIVNLVPAPITVLRRDRIVIILAVALLTALAWSYLLWLSADMNMGGMDMTGFRMIPSGMSLMVPKDMPWRAIEFAFVFAMWTVMMVGMMTPIGGPDVSHVLPRGPTNRGAGQATRGNCLVRCRLFPRMDSVFAVRHAGAMGAGA